MNLKATPISTLETTNPTSKTLSLKDYKVVLYHGINSINAQDWIKAAPTDNLFLHLDYLQVLEENPPKGMEFCYLLFYKAQEPIGIAQCQIQFFKADQNIRDNNDEKAPCFFTTITRYLKDLVAKKAEFNVLINGNLLLTGEHGFHFKTDHISEEDCIQVLDEALNYALSELNNKGKKLSGILLKEFYESNRSYSETFSKNLAFNEFTVQPNMIMDVRPDWKSYEDYLDSMTSKYRVRAKRASKKGKPFVKRPLNDEEIEASLDRLYELYEGIAENSGFNMVNLNRHYLLELKRTFPERFKMTGYYLDNQLVGYYTTMLNDHELEAHFLGFDQSLNRDYQIYLNILYDIVNEGIESRVKKIIFARTAMEIKSSVGAIAEEMYCYLRHKNAFSNKFVRPILEYLRPDHEWQPRHPFK
jgi:hypothetical protein